jgi:VIT1/CCC1 family predicted Fe2+/Mn2+ transporter
MIEGRWYDLPEGDGSRIRRSKWVVASMIAIALIVIGAAIFLVAFAAKTNPAASIIGLILAAISLALLNNAGIPIGIVDQYLQTGNKVISGK